MRTRTSGENSTTLSSPVSSHDESPFVVDTVVLMYFTLVDELDLLMALAPDGLYTTPTVFDPDDAEASADAGCEIAATRHYYDQASSDPRLPAREQRRAEVAVQRVSAVDRLYQANKLHVAVLSDDEIDLFASLASTNSAQEVGLRRKLHPGEASCLAVAASRSWTLATDDSDALKALKKLAPQCGYERIRRLLIRAAVEARISEAQANRIHSEMRSWGFWDNKPPFPPPKVDS